jgi:MFS family permease
LKLTERKIVLTTGIVTFVALSCLFAFVPGYFGKEKISGDGWDNFAIAHSLFFDGDIDLENQFQRCCNQFSHPKNEDTGRVGSPHPLGTPILYLPFFVIAHLVASITGEAQDAGMKEGISLTYFWIVTYSSVCYGSLGLAFTYLFLRRRFHYLIALLSSVSILLATPLLFYMVFHPSYSHPMDFFATSFFLWFWDRTSGRMTIRRWALLGILLGFSAIVREPLALLAIVPFVEALTYLFAKDKEQGLSHKLARLLVVGLSASLGFSLVFSVQVMAWMNWFGKVLAVPQGAFFVQWAMFSFENLLNILFWSRHGLVSWHPVHLFAILGLLLSLRREPMKATALVLALCTQFYIATVCLDLWAGWSFGHRRFIAVEAIFAFGLAHLFSFVIGLFGRKLAPVGGILLCLLSFPFMALDISQIWRMYHKTLEVGRTMDMKHVYGIENLRIASLLWEKIGNPFSFPAILYYKLRFELPPKRFDSVLGEYVMFRFEPTGKRISERLLPTSSKAKDYILHGAIGRVEEEDRFVMETKGSSHHLSLVLPIWVISDDLQITVRGNFLSNYPVLDPFVCSGCATLHFNGTDETSCFLGMDFTFSAIVPLAWVNFGLNRLDIEIISSCDGKPFLSSIDLQARW